MNQPTNERCVVAITGAAGRLGRRMVYGFGKSGARLAALVRSEGPLDGADAVLAADLTDEADVTRVFQELHDTFGRLDVLVHTVGAWAASPLLDTCAADFERMLRINLTTTMLCFREASRLMTPTGGRLIAFASAQGADRARARQASYSASKAGVIRLVESAAEELRPINVTTHAIAPSFVLYDDNASKGVKASALVDLALYLAGPAGASLSGATLRAYGTAD